jgi:D-threo-aldose 1-dehydrogenase
VKSNVVGRTNVSVTELGFGAASIGNLFSRVSDEEAHDAVALAWDRGVRYFDTAPHYGLGLSERRLGAALASRPRGEFVVSTKVGRLLRANPHPRGSDLEAGGFDTPDELARVFDYSASGVHRSLEESLERLGLGYVDIVYVHDPDDHVDQVIEETIPTLVKLRDEHVIGAIGVGMNDWRPLLQFVHATDLDVVMLAGRWTLLDRSGQTLVDECRRRNVAVVAAAPFNSGILSKNAPTSDQRFDYRTVSSARLEKAQELAILCARYGIDLPHAALRFALRDEAVAAVVAGMRSPREVGADVEWIETPIPAALWDELDSVEVDGGHE